MQIFIHHVEGQESIRGICTRRWAVLFCFMPKLFEFNLLKSASSSIVNSHFRQILWSEIWNLSKLKQSIFNRYKCTHANQWARQVTQRSRLTGWFQLHSPTRPKSILPPEMHNTLRVECTLQRPRWEPIHLSFAAHFVGATFYAWMEPCHAVTMRDDHSLSCTFRIDAFTSA